MSAGEAVEVLREAGFVLKEEGGADDEDGSIGPPPCASAHGGGVQSIPMQFGNRAAPIEIWSQVSGAWAGFAWVYDEGQQILYAKLLKSQEEDYDASSKHVLRASISTLLDVAEACYAQKVTLGLGTEHSGADSLVFSLLDFGFQVAPPRKTPFKHLAYLLDFEQTEVVPEGLPEKASENSGVRISGGKSDCSTYAEEETRQELEPVDSD